MFKCIAQINIFCETSIYQTSVSFSFGTTVPCEPDLQYNVQYCTVQSVRSPYSVRKCMLNAVNSDRKFLQFLRLIL